MHESEATTQTPPRVSPGTPIQPPRMPDHELLHRIGRGSYGEVWLARGVTGAYRAVKIVRRESFEHERPFEREFSGILQFEPISRKHESQVDILHVGRGDGYFYYVMDLADDQSTGQQINPDSYAPKTVRSELFQRGKLPFQECVRIGLALTTALENLHSHGLVHRDVKPSNIIFVNGVAKLADIGLVTGVDATRSHVGTEGFAPPEGPGSAQADVYSLGKVLYEMATGKDRQDFPELPTNLAELSECEGLVELNAVIAKACRQNVRERYPSARAMHGELLLLQAGKSIRRKRAGERRFKVFAVAGAMAVVLTLLAFSVDRVLDWRVQSVQQKRNALRPDLIGKVEPRDPQAPPQTIDLTPFYTAALGERWYPSPEENTLSSLPRGLRTLAGVKFDVRGLVQLSGHEISSYGADSYPVATRIPLGNWVKRLHFLHGSVSEMADGGKIGSYRIRYGTDRSVEIPIRYGRDLRALWQPMGSSGVVSNATVAWSGENPPSRERQLALRLYKMTWENPSPNDEILGVEFVSEMKNSAPFLVAITAEDHRPSTDQWTRPVDLLQTLQSKANSFPQLTPNLGSHSGAFTLLKLNPQAVQIDNRYYSGIRFTAPRDVSMDLVWAAKRLPGAHVGGWYILPMKGGMKVGFEDWYHRAGSAGISTSKASSELVLQQLNAKKLERGRDYFIWFSFDAPQPVEFEAAMTFVPNGQVDANNPESLAKALGLIEAGGPEQVTFHRHYCLGALR